ncbi:MAG: TlpA disulfide reductase family protein [Planctomycetia bacterium]|nr:TlpA disulfide reductase family protein [Planctomycetia bacterium]
MLFLSKRTIFQAAPLSLFLLVSFSMAVAEEVSQKVGEFTLPSVVSGAAPRSVAASPLEGSVASLRRTKNLWADSWLFLSVPMLREDGQKVEETDDTASVVVSRRLRSFLKVEEWYKEAPSLEGKCLLVEFSASWCPVCRREIPLLNHWAEKYAGRLEVISIYETDRASLATLPGDYQGKDMRYFVGIDTQRRSANALGVFGIPHVILIEPKYGGIVWEGMPMQPGYELTDEIIEKVLAIAENSTKAANEEKSKGESHE